MMGNQATGGNIFGASRLKDVGLPPMPVPSETAPPSGTTPVGPISGMLQPGVIPPDDTAGKLKFNYANAGKLPPTGPMPVTPNGGGGGIISDIVNNPVVDGNMSPEVNPNIQRPQYGGWGRNRLPGRNIVPTKPGRENIPKENRRTAMF